jgi:hypothetical protein
MPCDCHEVSIDEQPLYPGEEIPPDPVLTGPGKTCKVLAYYGHQLLTVHNENNRWERLDYASKGAATPQVKFDCQGNPDGPLTFEVNIDYSYSNQAGSSATDTAPIPTTHPGVLDLPRHPGTRHGQVGLLKWNPYQTNSWTHTDAQGFTECMVTVTYSADGNRKTVAGWIEWNDVSRTIRQEFSYDAEIVPDC